jgi:hypothetical protein
VNALEEYEGEPVPSLDELAETVRTEHDLVVENGNAVIEHAIRCGLALLAAREICPPGEWGEWMERNVGGSSRTARAYMRIARLRDRPELVGHTAVWSAVVSLSHLPNSKSGPDISWDVEEARKLRASGMGYREIGREFGVSGQAIKDGLDSNYRLKRRAKQDEFSRRKQAEKKAREAAAEAALLERRIGDMRKIGGGVHEAYVQCVKLMGVFHTLADTGSSQEIRENMASCYRKQAVIEDLIRKAQGVA